MLWDSGKNENVNMSTMALVVPLLFLGSVFIAKTLSLFILNILSWILKRLSLFFVCLLFYLCTIALTLHFSGCCGYLRLGKRPCIGECPKEKHRDEYLTA